MRFELCADNDPHEKHIWGWPPRRCLGVRPEESKDLLLAQRMARVFHAEELRQQQAHQALWKENSLFVDLPWDVLPWNTKQEKIEAMYRVVQSLNGDLARQLWRDEKDPMTVVDIHAAIARGQSRLRRKAKHGRPKGTANPEGTRARGKAGPRGA